MSKARLGKIAVLVAVSFWSLGNLIVRGTDLTGPQIAFWRYLIAAVIYAIGHQVVVGPLRWSDFRVAAPMGVVLGLEIAAFFVAIKNTSVANVTVIGSMTPLLLLGVAMRRFDERVSRAVMVATVLALLGVAAVIFGSTAGFSINPLGDTLAVVALLLFAGYFVLGKVARETLSGITLQTHSLIAGVPVLFVVLLIDSGGIAVPTGSSWWSVLGLVAFPSTGHLLISWAHAHVSLTLLSLLTLIVPVFSTAGALVLFDETVTAIQVGGMALVLAVLSFAVVENSKLAV